MPLKDPDIKKSDHHRVIFLGEGVGVYQVDFRNYVHEQPRVLFLNPEQYFARLAGSFSVEEIRIPQNLLPQDPAQDVELRLLFSHIYEVGSIGPNQRLEQTLSSSDETKLIESLRHASDHWRASHPLHPQITDRELDLLFDLRRHIELHFRERRKMADYGNWIHLSPKRINQITKSRIQLALGELIDNRLMVEAKRALYFTSMSAKEIAYELGFKDPAYFNRYFLKHAGVTPTAFRKGHSNKRIDPFLEKVLHLVDQHYITHRDVAFYAEKLFMTPKSLSAKIKQLTGHPLSRIIRRKLVLEIQQHLRETSAGVSDIATQLNFSDPFHLSHFFKHETGISPTGWREGGDGVKA